MERGTLIVNAFVFFFAAALALVGSTLVFVFRNTVYSVVSLITALTGVAVLFFQLGAAFIGALQIILYAGAILVLFLFVVMLLNVHKDEMGPDRRRVQNVLALALGSVLFGYLMTLGHALGSAGPAEAEFGSARGLAEVFFSKHVLAFELTSFLLLAAMIGTVVLARRGEGEA